MSKFNEHKTVQARIITYAQEVGWTYVSREEAERRRGFNRIEHKDRREGLDSGSLRFLRLISGASVSNFSGR